MSCESKFLNVKTILYKAYANYSYPLFKAYTSPTNEDNQFHHLALKVNTENLNVNYLSPSICEVALCKSYFLDFMSMRKLYERNL